MSPLLALRRLREVAFAVHLRLDWHWVVDEGGVGARLRRLVYGARLR